MRKGFVASVQILIEADDVYDGASAADWMSALLSQNAGVRDWSYLTLGAQTLYPQGVHLPFDYEEGDFLTGRVTPE